VIKQYTKWEREREREREIILNSCFSFVQCHFNFKFWLMLIFKQVLTFFAKQCHMLWYFGRKTNPKAFFHCKCTYSRLNNVYFGQILSTDVAYLPCCIRDYWLTSKPWRSHHLSVLLVLLLKTREFLYFTVKAQERRQRWSC